jgi:hypothetical protein
MHATTHLPPAGPPEAHAEVLCRRRRRNSNSSSMCQHRREATANGDSNTPKVYRRVAYLTTVQIKPVIFTLPRCTSADGHVNASILMHDVNPAEVSALRQSFYALFGQRPYFICAALSAHCRAPATFTEATHQARCTLRPKKPRALETPISPLALLCGLEKTSHNLTGGSCVAPWRHKLLFIEFAAPE